MGLEHIHHCNVAVSWLWIALAGLHNMSYTSASILAELKLSCNCFDPILAALTLYHASFRDRHFNSVECKEVVCVSDKIEGLCVGVYSAKPVLLL